MTKTATATLCTHWVDDGWQIRDVDGIVVFTGDLLTGLELLDGWLRRWPDTIILGPCASLGPYDDGGRAGTCYAVINTAGEVEGTGPDPRPLLDRFWQLFEYEGGVGVGE